MTPLAAGDLAPWFQARSAANPRYEFHTVAGRPIVLCFFASTRQPGVAGMLELIRQQTGLFDDYQASFFGVSCDPTDETNPLLAERYPGFRQFWDFDLRLSRQFGLCASAKADDGRVRYSPASVVLGRDLRVLAMIPLALGSANDAATHVQQVCQVLASTVPPPNASALPNAPVLVAPNVLEPALCRELIDYYEAIGGEDSGYMKSDESGRTIGVIDYSLKRRRDCTIEDAALRLKIRERIMRRLVPLVQNAFQFRATQSERYLVACYDAGEGGYFRPHRDNTTRGTAHRRFAVTLNLNTEEYEGGALRFPEFSDYLYRAPAGGAVVFSCSLLHEATPVTRGRRYCVLPFLYDEAAARLRQRLLEEDAKRAE